MVSGFFSGGAADQFLKEGRLEEVRERTDIMGQQADTAFARVQNQAEQFKRTELIENLSIQNQKLLNLDKFFALKPEAARTPSMQQARAGLVKLIDDLSAAANRSSTTGLSPALGAAEAGTPIAAAGAEAGARIAGKAEATEGLINRPLSTQEQLKQAGALPGEGGVTVEINQGLRGEGKKAIDKTRNQLEAIPGLLDKTSAALKSIKASPLAAGAPGNILESGSALLQSFGNLVGVDLSTKDQKAFDTARNDARLLTAELVSVVTGDDSGRYTDTEQKIARDTARILSGNSSAQQVVNALTNMLGVLRDDRRRVVGKAIVQGNIDLTTNKGRNELFKVLQSTGFDENNALDAIQEQLAAKGIKF